MKDKIKEIIKKDQEDGNFFDHYGLRLVREGQELSVGDYPANSMEWVDDIETGVGLNGVCAIGIGDDLEEAIESLKDYEGCQKVLLGSYYASNGNDPEEIIMKDSLVMAIF